jgi:hypothetical protein
VGEGEGEGGAWMDYLPDVTGNPSVGDDTYDPKTFGGFVFYARRLAASARREGHRRPELRAGHHRPRLGRGAAVIEAVLLDSTWFAARSRWV